jgi:peptide/nickel transport system ATP-binding protein
VVDFTRDGKVLHAVRGVTLEIGQGEVLGLVGESGSGKSVLGSALLGLLPRSVRSISGSVTVDGVDMIAGPERQRRRARRFSLGAVFQDPMTSLNPTQRIGRQLFEVTGSDEESTRLLDAVGIPQAKERLRAYPHELSGGLSQRVMIAMSLAGDPRLLVADEPTTAVDVNVQAQILTLLRSLCDTLGLSILFITHDLGVASQLSDRIAVMYGGRLAEVGSAADVLDRPSHPYTSALLQSRLTMQSDRGRQLLALDGEAPNPFAPLHGCPFGSRCSHHQDVCDAEVPTLRPAAGTSVVTACVRQREIVSQPIDVTRGMPWPPAVEASAVPVVEVKDARKVYRIGKGKASRALHALDGVDLTVESSEAVAIVGLSGSGKSTLLRAIAGLIDLDSGDIRHEGSARPQIVFQDAGSSLTPWMSVGELIGERLRRNGQSSSENQERIAEAMRAVGLSPQLRNARSAQLSGGQRQRAAIARAIVDPPSLLLCDEPTSALDVSLAATVLNLLGRLRRELGIAMLFVTHDLAAARLIGDRLVVMQDGQIVETGATEALIRDPQHALTKSLLASLPGTRPADRPAGQQPP